MPGQRAEKGRRQRNRDFEMSPPLPARRLARVRYRPLERSDMTIDQRKPYSPTRDERGLLLRAHSVLKEDAKLRVRRQPLSPPEEALASRTARERPPVDPSSGVGHTHVDDP